MAKREVRSITASSDIAAIIDHGADVDTQIKKLGIEDKGLKAKIVETAEGSLGEEELSVRMVGSKASAIVSGVEKLELDVSSEVFPLVREAIGNGFLSGVVNRNLALVVPPEDIERSAAALKQAGIRASVSETLSVSAEALREDKTISVEEGQARGLLRKCLKRDLSFRVKYDKA